MKSMRVFLCCLLLASAATVPCTVASPSESGQVPKPRVIVVADRGPQSIPYQKDLTVLKAIAASGGFTDFAGRPVFLIRAGQPKKVNVIEMASDPKKVVPLEAWDIVVAERARAE